MDKAQFEKKYGITKPGRADPVIFFCRKGIRAKEGSDFIRFLNLKPFLVVKCFSSYCFRWGLQYTNTTTYSGILDWKANTERS